MCLGNRLFRDNWAEGDGEPRTSPPVSSGAAALLTAASWFHLCFPGLATVNIEPQEPCAPVPKGNPTENASSKQQVHSAPWHCRPRLTLWDYRSCRTEPGQLRQPRTIRSMLEDKAPPSPRTRGCWLRRGARLASTRPKYCPCSRKSQRQPDPNLDLAASTPV